MNSAEDNFYLVMSLRPDMTDADARWAAGLATEMQAAKARVKELEGEMKHLRAVMSEILDEATWDEEAHDDEEPTEDDMIEALTAIHAYARNALLRPASPPNRSDTEDR